MPGKEVGQCRVIPLRFKYIGKRGLGFRVEGRRIDSNLGAGHLLP